MTTKTNARTEILNFLAAKGWELDATATINWRGGWGSEDKTVQDPFAFRKAAADGGTWQVKLDFKVKDDGYWSSNRTDNRLRGVFVRKFAADGSEVSLPLEDRHLYNGNPLPLRLVNSDAATYAATSWIWEATGEEDKNLTLRKRAEKLFADPDLVVWLAQEAEYGYNQALRQEWATRRQEQELRNRPLPQGWNELSDVARAVVKADGLTDIASTLRALKDAIAEVEATLDTQEGEVG